MFVCAARAPSVGLNRGTAAFVLAVGVDDLPAATSTFPTSHSSIPYKSRNLIMAGGDFDDDLVANLLKQDAKAAVKRYDLVGIEAFNPKRCVASLRYNTRSAIHC